MWIDILSMFAISLVLTIIIESVFARCWGFKSQKETVLVILVNILTNPAAVFCAWLFTGLLGSNCSFGFQCVIEVIVVIVEAKVYFYFSREEGWNIKKPLQFAIIVNMVSWLSGVVIQYFI